MLSLTALPALADNYIWTLSAEDGAGIVVDPGDAGPVLQAIAQGLKPLAILITHHHPDHIGGVEQIAAAWPAPIYAPRDERIPRADHRVAGGDTVKIPDLGLDIKVLAVPGHTRSHVAYYDGARLFCGDTLFSLGCGRMFEGTANQMLASLDKLSALPPQTLVCCAHEYTAANGAFALQVDPTNQALADRCARVSALRREQRPTLPSTLASEHACNPFLRVDSSAVRASLAAHSGQQIGSRASCFAALRAWKDTF